MIEQKPVTGIVQFIREYRTRDANPITTRTVIRTLTFPTYEDAVTFADRYSNELIGHTGAWIIAEASRSEPATAHETYHYIYSLSIENGRYVAKWDLYSNEEVAQNDALLSASTDNLNAFALKADGAVLKLENGNVGIRTFYTQNDYLAEELNAEALS